MNIEFVRADNDDLKLRIKNAIDVSNNDYNLYYSITSRFNEDACKKISNWDFKAPLFLNSRKLKIENEILFFNELNISDTMSIQEIKNKIMFVINDKLLINKKKKIKYKDVTLTLSEREKLETVCYEQLFYDLEDDSYLPDDVAIALNNLNKSIKKSNINNLFNYFTDTDEELIFY